MCQADWVAFDGAAPAGVNRHVHGRAPSWIVLLDRDDQALDLKRQLIAMAAGPPQPVGEAFMASFLVAIEDLVAGLCRQPRDRFLRRSN